MNAEHSKLRRLYMNKKKLLKNLFFFLKENLVIKLIVL